MKSVLVAIGMIASGVLAQSKCSLTISTYSDNTCSTSKEVLPMYVNGVASINMQFHKCLSVTGNGQAPYMQTWICDPDHFVALGRYTDSNCMVYEQIPVRGYAPNVCQIESADTWVKVTNVKLTGNKFGIGYVEAWSIFLCQTVLFGVCAGY